MSNENIAREAGAVAPVAWDMPCGACGCGIYDQAAMDAFNGTIPKCKTMDRPCVGAGDTAIATINTLRAQLEAAERELLVHRRNMELYLLITPGEAKEWEEAEARAEAAEAEVARLGAVLDQIAGYTMSQFKGAFDMAFQCKSDASAARTKEAAP